MVEGEWKTRSSIKRWTNLSMLMASLERMADVSGRLDAYVYSSGGRGRPVKPYSNAEREIYEARERVLASRIDREIDLLTAELLREQLNARQKAA